jgi:hypothetical protein
MEYREHSQCSHVPNVIYNVEDLPSSDESDADTADQETRDVQRRAKRRLVKNSCRTDPAEVRSIFGDPAHSTRFGAHIVVKPGPDVI